MLLILFYKALYVNEQFPTELYLNKFLLFLLWYVNVLLITAVLVVIGRILLKIWLERKSGILGVRFRTKLVATYVAISLIPTVVLFFFASDLLQKTVEKWLTVPSNALLSSSSTISSSYIENIKEMVRKNLVKIAGYPFVSVSELSASLHKMFDSGVDVDFIALYLNGEFVIGAVRAGSDVEEIPYIPHYAIRDAEINGESEWGDDNEGVYVRVKSLDRIGKGVVIAAGMVLDKDVVAALNTVANGYSNIRRLASAKEEIFASQKLIMLTITLMVILSTVWTSIHLSKTITDPISSLVSATRRVKDGDFSVFIEDSGEDELGELIRSFNLMTAELGKSKRLLETRNKELLEANKRLEDERNFVIALLKSIDAGVIAVDNTNRISLINKKARDMLLIECDPCEGKTLGDVLKEEHLKDVKDFSERCSSGEEEFKIVSEVGVRIIEVKITPIVRAGDVQGKVIVLEDLTTFVRAKQMATWREAARRIAHEIKNPLTPIRLSSERILRRYKHLKPKDLEKLIEDGLKTVIKEVDRLQKMVDGFSRFAQLLPPSPVTTEVRKIVEDAASLYKGVKSGVDIIVKVEPTTLKANLDPAQIKSALVNLVDNAVAAITPPGKVEIIAYSNNSTLILEVKDDGKGIPPKDRNKIFIPYFSTKEKGSGLGLSIVYKIVHDHSGEMVVSDNLPKGTSFVMKFPNCVINEG